MNKKQIVVILESLKERNIEIEDAIFDIEVLDEDNSIVEELAALEDDEKFEMKVKGLISLVEDSDIKYRKASYKDVKKLVSNSSLEELNRLIRNIRDE